MMSHEEEHEAWASVTTLEEYAARTIDWLGGRLTWTPDHGEQDTETHDLVPALVRINQLGLVTTESQPGQSRDANGSAQRAYIEGLCSEETVEALASGLSTTDIVLVQCPPGDRAWLSIAVTLDAGEGYSFLGRYDAQGSAELYREVGEGLAQLALESWQVQVFDPVWGRNDRLWPAVISALEAGKS